MGPHRVEVGRIIPGRVYRYVGRNGGGTLYRVLYLARHGRTSQRVVVYEGLDGADLGERWTATPAEFVTLFEPAAKEVEPESAPERVAGVIPEGTGA